MTIVDVQSTAIEGLKVLTPPVHSDARGYFLESFNNRSFCDATGLDVRFVQDNESMSCAGALRGLHYQVEQAQGKLVRVVRGEVFDVAVDLRRSSATFGHWYGVTLSDRNRKQLWMPTGFAHGFLALSKSAVVAYKVTDYYCRRGECAIAWDDPDLAIDWPLAGAPTLSDRDRAAPRFRDAEAFA